MILAAAGQSDLGLKRSRVVSFVENSGGLGAHKREAIGRVLLKRIVPGLGANNGGWRTCSSRVLIFINANVMHGNPIEPLGQSLATKDFGGHSVLPTVFFGIKGRPPSGHISTMEGRLRCSDWAELAIWLWIQPP